MLESTSQKPWRQKRSATSSWSSRRRVAPRKRDWCWVRSSSSPRHVPAKGGLRSGLVSPTKLRPRWLKPSVFIPREAIATAQPPPGTCSGMRSTTTAISPARARTTSRRLPCTVRSVLNALGNVETDLGQLDSAKSHYEQTLAIAQEIRAKNTAAGALGNIANVLDNLGLLEEARKKQEEGLQAFREVGNKRGEGSTLSNLANLLSELGELEAAQQRYNGPEDRRADRLPAWPRLHSPATRRHSALSGPT